MDSYSDIVCSFINKTIKSKLQDFQNLEIEFDLNKSKNPLYIDYNVYSKLIKYLSQMSKSQKLSLKVYNIVDVSYKQQINNNILSYRISLTSEGNKPIPIVSNFKNKRNSIVFKSLVSYCLKKDRKSVV